MAGNDISSDNEPFGSKNLVDTDQIVLSDTATATKILQLKKGFAVIKASIDNTGNVFIGRKGVTTSKGHELGPGDVVGVGISPKSELKEEYLEFYAIPATASDKVSYMKIPSLGIMSLTHSASPISTFIGNSTTNFKVDKANKKCKVNVDGALVQEWS